MIEAIQTPETSGSIFDSLTMEIQARVVELDTATARLTDLEKEVEAAREAAFAPFAEPMKRVRQDLHEAESYLCVKSVLERLKDLPQDEVEATAFTFLMAGKDLEKLAEQYVMGLRGDKYSLELAEYTFARLDGFAQFYRTLINSTEPLPVLAIDMSWEEEIDMQAEYEGRPSGTGKYEKACNLTLGLVDSSAIEIERADDADGFNIIRPSVGLNLYFLPDSKQIVSEREWGCIESTTIVCQDSNKLVLVRLPEYRRAFGVPINWSAGRQPDLSMMESVEQYRSPSVQRRKERESYIIYESNNVEVALQKLLTDDSLPESTRREVQKLL